MEQALFPLTIGNMRSPDDRIVLQAIEFWSTVCEEESYLIEEAEEAMEYGEQPERDCQYFARAALSQVIPLLLWLLTRQDEDADEDEWNPSMAAATCLSLFAQTVRDEIVPPVVPFVESNIRNQDWHNREAAVMAFGSILDGPSSEVLQPLVSQALAVLIEMTQDPSVLVKDTAAWTLGRICDMHVVCINIELHLQNLIGALLKGMEDSPRVAANCAWVINLF
jgi:importin subunit beta-1